MDIIIYGGEVAVLSLNHTQCLGYKQLKFKLTLELGIVYTLIFVVKIISANCENYLSIQT